MSWHLDRVNWKSGVTGIPSIPAALAARNTGKNYDKHTQTSKLYAVLKEKCSKGRDRIKEKAGTRGWILFGVSVPHTQTERPQAPGGGVGDRI